MSKMKAVVYAKNGTSVPQIFKSIFFGPWMSTGDRKMRVQNAKANPKDLAFLMELLASGKIHPVIDRHYLLSDAPEAFRYLNEGHARGKVVISVINEKAGTSDAQPRL